MNYDPKTHWETIYKNKEPQEVSWTQETPASSLDLIEKCGLDKSASIIDVGGGNSNLVDFLLEKEYSDITVLDISEEAILRAKSRLGEHAAKVKWIISDILDFIPEKKYDLWHDRAAFHFLTEEDDIEKYMSIVENAVEKHVVMGTFSVDGPKKCSGLDIKQYSEESMEKEFKLHGFRKTECRREDHKTPSGSLQNFVFCSFTKA